MSDKPTVKNQDGVKPSSGEPKPAAAAGEKAYQELKRFSDAIGQLDHIIVSEKSIDRMLDRIIEKCRGIFECDRAWLFYPCDPKADAFSVSVESTHPDYPGAKSLGMAVPMTADMAEYCKAALASGNRVTEDPPHGRTMTNDIAIRFRVQSLVYTALRPSIGDAWMFGLHQCRNKREWTEEDKRLFQRIGFRITEGLSSKLYLARIEESENRYRRLFESALDAVLVFDLKTFQVLDGNAKAVELTGLHREQLLAKSFAELFAGKQKATIQKAMSHAVEADERQLMNPGRLLRKGGASVPVEIYVKTVDIGRQKTGLAQIRDISERKQAEEKQHKTELQLYNALEMARLGHWEYDVLGDMFIFNDQFYRIFKTSAEEVGGYTVSSAAYARRFVHPDDMGMVAEEIQRAIETDDPDYTAQLEHRIIYADGAVGTISVRYFIVKDKTGQTIRTFGVNQDITEQRLAEKEIRDREEIYRKVVNTAPYGIQLTDPEGKIVFSNPAHHRLQGYPNGGLIGKTIWDLMADDKHKAYARDYYKKIIAEQPVPKSYFNRDRTQDGREIDVQVDWDYIRAANGDVEGILSIITDITDKKLLEARLGQAQKMESMGHLAGGIAHDFNNILSPILGMAEMLMEDLPAGSQEREKAEVIRKAGIRGSELAQQILAFGRQTEYRKQPVRVDRVLSEVLRLCRSTIPSNIPIETDLRCNDSWVMADPTQLHQVALNLMTNAYQAVEETGGKIGVTLDEMVIKTTEAKDPLIKPGKYVCLRISDTGHGIEPMLLHKIFDPYFTTKAKEKGTGLGLSVVYGIVKDHGGDTQVRSVAGEGSVFTVYFPQITALEQHGDKTEPTTDLTGTERILLVDDEGPVLNMERQMLKRLGYDVTAVQGSSIALETFKAGSARFDLVITDMTMPEMTGDQLSRELLSIRPDIPILICTGFSKNIDQKKIEAIGVKGLIMKPVVKSQMAKAVREALNK